MTQDLPYFAYGSNLDRQDWQQWCRDSGRSSSRDSLRPLGPAYLPDFALRFNYRSVRRGNGALNIHATAGRCVAGALFAPSQDGWAALDEKEGAGLRYERIPVTVLLPDGREQPALTYRVLPAFKEVDCVPPGEPYLQAVCRGRAEIGHDQQAVHAAAQGREPQEPMGVFVYGTLQPGGRNYPAVAPFVDHAQPAWIGGSMVDLGSYPGLSAVSPAPEPPQRDGRVHGHLLSIEALPQALRAVDPIEDFHGWGRSDNLYRRVVVRVWLDGVAAPSLAWSYLYLGDLNAAHPLPDGRWR